MLHVLEESGKGVMRLVNKYSVVLEPSKQALEKGSLSFLCS